MKRGKLGQDSGARRALFRSLSAAVLLHGRIETTEAKAKSVQAMVDKLITLGKRGDLHARRQAAAFLNDPEAVKKLFETVAPRYKERNGGYTRVLRTSVRRGDGAPLALLELVS